MLHLRGPVREVLHFVEQQVHRAALRVRKRVDGLPQHLIGVPRDQIEHRRFQPLQLRDVVELHPEDAPGLDAIVEQRIDDLVQGGGLAHLARTAQHRHRCQPVAQPLDRRRERPAAHQRHPEQPLAAPPRIAVAPNPFGAGREQSGQGRLRGSGRHGNCLWTPSAFGALRRVAKRVFLVLIRQRRRITAPRWAWAAVMPMKKPFWAGTSLHGPSASRVLVLVRSHLPPTHASQGCSRNHVVKTEFLKPRLVGERFNAHSIPVEVLKDWAAFEGLIVEAARWLYLQENPRRTRTPRGFAQSFTRRTVTR